jgi:hypothetical protein
VDDETDVEVRFPVDVIDSAQYVEIVLLAFGYVLDY